MTTVIQVLERLAQARERDQLERILRGYTAVSTNNTELFQSIDYLKRITRICMKKQRQARRLSARR